MATPREFFSDRFHYTYGAHEPTIRLESGDSLCVVCPDSDNGLADGTVLAPEQRQQSEGGPLFEGNPVAGPIHVNGAHRGGVLAVTIEKIEFDRTSGRTLLAPGHGLLSSDELLRPDEFFSTERNHDDGSVPTHMYEWSISPTEGTATVTNPVGDQTIVVPLNPMVGTIGVCPPWGENISTLMAGVHGGNIDLPIVGASATVLLPVFCDGGLLMLDDLHAAQGHGEIVGGGIETSGRVTISVQNLSYMAIGAPMVVTEDSMFAVKVHGDMRIAVRGAYAYLVDWLATEGGLNRWDAYQLVSQIGRIEIGGMTAPSTNVVAAGISLDVLPASALGPINAFL